MQSRHVCPVCELPVLVAQPEMGPVCPACGTEFEVDDRYSSHAELRHAWLNLGAPWFSSVEPPPHNWQEHRAALLAHLEVPTVDVGSVSVSTVDWVTIPFGWKVA